MTLAGLYSSRFGSQPARIERLTAASGSNRRYYRLFDSGGGSVIGVEGISKEENNAFVYLARHFRTAGLNAPEVYAVSPDRLYYLQEDLGNTTLYDALRRGREAGGDYNEEEKELLRTVIKYLPKLQITGAEGINYDKCYPVPAFDIRSIRFDLNYFKYCFLLPSGAEYNELHLEEAFDLFAAELLREPLNGFMYRDFQARNVMLKGETLPYLIDFQGGRLGPVYYDLVSFLWQASANYGAGLRRELIELYYNELRAFRSDIPEYEEFTQRVRLFALFRTLQVLGAYGFRGLYERKAYFIKSIPAAVANLRELIAADNFNFGCLYEVLRQIAGLDKYKTAPETDTTRQKLIVQVWSFSYKNGIPQDDSRHGGGYVFDCRAANNPGRYAEYQHLTGRDEAVKRFIEEDGELLTLLDSVYTIADKHVSRWLQRGFTSLVFAFGCTGGRHRSVYAAERLAAHINGKYGVEVRINHRELNITSTLPEQITRLKR
ncbi:MAG: phosphotransferase [Prevotella sp.]|nr:phosphotransferase [Prevotella sp.]